MNTLRKKTLEGRLRDFAAGVFATAVSISPFMQPQAIAQPMNPPSISGQQMPGKTASEQGDVYNFSGKIRNVLDSTAVADAELIFRYNGAEYKARTDANGNYNLSGIDTYVEVMEPDEILDDIALSAPLKNPTGGRTGFVVNIPRPTKAQFKVYNILGQELTDVVDGPIDGGIGRGQYQLNLNMRGNAAGVYVATLATPDGVVTQPFTYMPGATEFNGNVANPNSWKQMKKPARATANGWTLEIRKDGHYPRETVLTPMPGGNTIDESVTPTSFDMAFFDEVTGRSFGGGTQRWMQVPKLYIIDGALEGYTGFETPTAEQIQIIKDVWKYDITPFTNYFIDIPDSNIYIGHDVNDPVFKRAVEQIGNGSVIRKKGWNVILWTNTLPGSGGHQETEENGVIVDAQQRYRPTLNSASMKGIGQIESSQSVGFAEDAADETKRWKDGDFTELYKQCGKYNYSRTPTTMSPDKSTQ